jgi:hypothetical protein
MTNFEYYFDNAKERLSSPHTIKSVQFNTTYRGDNYVQINYVYNHIEGKRVDFEGQFVSIFYNTKEELEKTLNELT